MTKMTVNVWTYPGKGFDNPSFHRITVIGEWTQEFYDALCELFHFVGCVPVSTSEEI